MGRVEDHARASRSFTPLWAARDGNFRFVVEDGTLTGTGAADQPRQNQDAGEHIHAGLDGLLQTSARSCPGAILFRDDEGMATAWQAASYSAALAGQFRQCGLRPGERVLLVMSSRTIAVLALAGALRAGLVPVLLPCGLGPVELAGYAKVSAAAALVGPSHLGRHDYGESYLSAAALSDTIRLIATLGPGRIDGAADFQASAIVPSDGSTFPDDAPESLEGDLILTFERPAHPAPASGAPLVPHLQSAIFSAVLPLATEAQLNPLRPLISTLVPATFGGLVAGPYAALMAAASLTLHGPFDAAGFLRACDGEPGAHLIVPAAIAPVLHEAGLTRGDASLILLSRFPTAEDFTLPTPLSCERRVVDLYALGETAVLAHSREGGTASWPAALGETRLSTWRENRAAQAG
jgi:hypothetical protein